jgi:hypothetical protein
MDEIDGLLLQMEEVRKRLNDAVADGNLADSYDVSLEMDRLLERYIEWQEKKKMKTG